MLQKADRVPHFEVTAVGGQTISYSAIWQRQNLALVVLPGIDSEQSRIYIAALEAKLPEFASLNTACVITRDSVPGMDGLGALVADKWGEIAYAVKSSTLDALPSAADFLEWSDYLQRRCPECEGEAR